jgi:hypothetical protein
LLSVYTFASKTPGFLLENSMNTVFSGCKTSL